MQAPDDAARTVRGMVVEAYQSLRHGKREGVLPLLADRVYAVGPGPQAVVVGRSEVVVALGALFPAGDKRRIRSRGLRVGIAPGGRAAWVTDQLDVDRVHYDATAVLAQVGGVWVAVAIDVGRPVAKAPGGVSPAVGRGVDGGATAAVKLFISGLEHPERLPDQLADSDDAVVMGPGPRDLHRGARAIRRAWTPARPKHRHRHRHEHEAPPPPPPGGRFGDVRAGVTPDGALAWVSAQVARPVKTGALVPGRAFHIYQRVGGRWRLVAAHEVFAAAAR